MKLEIFLFSLGVILFTGSSCSKNKLYDSNIAIPVNMDGRAVSRKIQFSLFTRKDFKNESHRIQFSLFIRNSDNKMLWDTMLPLMSIRDIPGEINKIFIEKQVSDADSSLLRAGFIYSIENVGASWHLDTCSKSTSVKKIDFNFQ